MSEFAPILIYYVNSVLDGHILGVIAYLSMLGFLIHAFFLISHMDHSGIPDLNIAIPGSSNPGNSGDGDRERERDKRIKRCRRLVKAWIANYCRQVCVGRGLCQPKCVSQMSAAEEEGLLNHIWQNFQFDEERPSLRRIDYVWRKAQNLAPSEVNKHPIMRAWRGHWDWDDY